MIPLALPDVPRWVAAHGIASAPGAWRAPLGEDAYALGHDPSRLCVIVGAPPIAATLGLAAAHAGHTLLLPREAEAAATALAHAGRPLARALLHTLDDRDAVPDLDGAVPLDADAPLAHVPDDLAAELASARARGPVWSVWLDEVPVAFAYAPWRSAAWCDGSVEVLRDARQLGLGTIVAAALIRDELGRGRAPVWAAGADQPAALRLARRLGFGAPCDELWVVSP